MIRELRFTDRWQHFRAIWNREDQTNELLARLEERDRQLEAFVREHLAGGRVLVESGIVQASSTLTATASEQDIAGCSVDLALKKDELVRLRSVADCTITVANGVGVCVLSIGGVSQTRQAIHKAVSSGDRATISQQWEYTATDDSTVTFKLRGYYASGGATFGTPHTSLSYEVYR